MNDPKKYLSILGVLTIVCFALALMLGATFKSPAAVLQGLLTHDFDIWQYRMPRAILAVLVGAALALSGTIIQGIIHNPLASPDILSINHGASLAAVATLMMMPGTPVWALPVAACVGAAVAYLVLMLVAGRQAGPLQMALIGVALSAFYAAMTDYLMLSHPLEVNTAMVWLTGSLWGRTWSFVEMGAPLLILLLPLALLYSKTFDLLTLGESSCRRGRPRGPGRTWPTCRRTRCRRPCRWGTWPGLPGSARCRTSSTAGCCWRPGGRRCRRRRRSTPNV